MACKQRGKQYPAIVKQQAGSTELEEQKVRKYSSLTLLAITVQTPNFGHYAAITSGFKSFLMIALWYSLGGLYLRLP